MPKFGPLISTTDLERRSSDPALRIVDCRFDLMNSSAGREAWAQSHIPGAVYADLDRDLAGPVTDSSGRHPLPAPDEAAKVFAELGIGNDSRIVVYDEGSGAIAARAWWMLRWLGHEDVALLDGGFAAWVAQRRPLQRGDRKAPAGDFRGAPQPERIVTTTDIERRLRAGQDPRLVDARDAARFRGEREPIDRVAGHIPGAVNLPFGRNLAADGRWKTGRELEAVWADAAEALAGCDFGVMCGSGVTACHLVLSARLAGLPEPRLYVGSWSEWIRDPDRPVATGP